MRIVILAPSPWSEVAVAAALRLARNGHVPVGALTLPTFHFATLLRKTMQWGPRSFASYAARRVAGKQSAETMRNPYLADDVVHEGAPVRTLGEAGRRLGFPVVTVPGMNSPQALGLVAEWKADALVYTGGGILRRAIIESTPVGVLNMHAGLLPEVRGMSCPEWSLLQGFPLGATVHLIDTGVDTGALLVRRELPLAEAPPAIQMVRNRVSAMAVEMLVEAVQGLSDGSLRPEPQPRRDEDLQYFVIHQSLARIAQERLDALRAARASGQGEVALAR